MGNLCYCIGKKTINHKRRGKCMNKTKKTVIWIVVAAIFVLLLSGAVRVIQKGVSAVADQFIVEQTEPANEKLTGGSTVSFPEQPFIGLVRVSGTIEAQQAVSAFETPAGYQHTATLEYINKLIDNDKNKGILLCVDSPGGTVYESEELYLKLKEYRERTGRPVWTYMEHYAASGGYMISCASDKIYANSNTTTGSIGVIISSMDMSGLYQKLGIRAISITSGKNKGTNLNDAEQVAIYQAMVDEYFERFVEIVSDGRNMTKEQVEKLADGRVYSAKQALGNGLIDEISGYEEMVAQMKQELGADILNAPQQKVTFLSQLFAKIADVTPKSEAEVLADFMEKAGDGVPMYYAEQLR